MRSPDWVKAKVCLVGEAAVGKTSLVRRFVFDEFSDAYTATLGTKVVAKEVAARADGEDVPLKMVIWDVIGETSLLEDLGMSYFYNVQAIVAVCDFTRYSTFERLPLWLRAVERVAGKVPAALAVNKVDLRGEAIVGYRRNRVQQFADDVGAKWYMTSAKTGENVEGMFSALGADIVSHARPHKNVSAQT